jgi:hypothetical protein
VSGAGGRASAGERDVEHYVRPLGRPVHIIMENRNYFSYTPPQPVSLTGRPTVSSLNKICDRAMRRQTFFNLRTSRARDRTRLFWKFNRHQFTFQDSCLLIDRLWFIGVYMSRSRALLVLGPRSHPPHPCRDGRVEGRREP